MQDYQRFFDGLAPRLETARMLERELDTQLARRFNALDYLRTDELGLSRIVADLLNPHGNHGQGAAFLKLLLEGLQYSAASEHLDHASVEVEVEKTIKDDRRLDICVGIGGHCLAIENKPYAGDQQDQIKDYLGWLKGQRFKSSKLIYLSPKGEPPSQESIELVHLGAESDADSFKIMPYHEVDRNAWGDGFDDYRLDYTLTEWLADCRKNCDVDRLRWFLREAETFCTRTFGGHTVTKNESSALRDFVLTDQKNWDVALTVSSALPEIEEEVYRCFIEVVWKTWPKESSMYPSDISYYSAYASPRRKSYMGMYRTGWQSSKEWKSRGYIQCTQLRLEAVSGVNDWYIGVCSTRGELTDREQKGRQKLIAALREALGASESETEEWPWWQWIEDEYRNWDTLIPALHQECKEGTGNITDYFVEKFAAIAKAAIPIIDEYEGA